MNKKPEKYWRVKETDGSLWSEHWDDEEDAKNSIQHIDKSQGLHVVKVEVYEVGQHPDTERLGRLLANCRIVLEHIKDGDGRAIHTGNPKAERRLNQAIDEATGGTP